MMNTHTHTQSLMNQSWESCRTYMDYGICTFVVFFIQRSDSGFFFRHKSLYIFSLIFLFVRCRFCFLVQGLEVWYKTPAVLHPIKPEPGSLVFAIPTWARRAMIFYGRRCPCSTFWFCSFLEYCCSLARFSSGSASREKNLRPISYTCWYLYSCIVSQYCHYQGCSLLYY
jgi:hypothetical protein